MSAKERAPVGDTEDDDGVTQRQLSLARAQGDAYGAALEELGLLHGERILDHRAGAFRVSSLTSPVHPSGGDGRGDAQHVWFSLFIRDAGDGRFVPSLNVEATLISAKASQDGPHRQAIAWHPTTYHYGRAWWLPGEGPHRFLVHIAPAPFAFAGSGPMPEFEAVSLEIPLSPCVSGAPEGHRAHGGDPR
ncbi:MAG TPA: hypothetical protein VFN48_08100 [Solirubrobacteraceae bacterium]|nr:hypothetical protein [Solirubrobacteraceae bacterium]